MQTQVGRAGSVQSYLLYLMANSPSKANEGQNQDTSPITGKLTVSNKKSTGNFKI